MGFEKFSVFSLEKKIGSESLERLKSVIPFIDESITEDSLFKKKNLARVLDSFSDIGLLKDRAIREEIIDNHDEFVLNDLCKKTDISVELEYEDKKQRILNKGWTDQQFCIAFASAYGINNNYIPIPKHDLPGQQIINSSIKPFKQLKDYQFGVYQEAKETLRYRLSRFIIQMPTGSGKTRTSIEFIIDYLNNAPDNAIVFWLVHSSELCEQAVQCFIEIYNHLGRESIELYRIWGKNTLPPMIMGKSFIVGGFQKMYAILKENPNIFETFKNRTGLIIIDEAHKVLAPTYKELTDSLIGLETRLVGLTATPGRNVDDFKENKDLANYFFKQIISISTPDDKPVISYLRERKILSKATFNQLKTSPSYNLSKKEVNYIETYYDYPPGFLRKLGNDDTRNIEILNELISAAQKYKKIIFFGTSVDHSKFICSTLVFLGIKAAHIDGQTEKGARNNILTEFILSNTQVVCNFGILSTGFDAPKTDLVFIARPTRSIVLYSQMIGRGLRGPEIGGTPDCAITTVKDNIIGLPDEIDIFDYFSDYFN